MYGKICVHTLPLSAVTEVSVTPAVPFGTEPNAIMIKLPAAFGVIVTVAVCCVACVPGTFCSQVGLPMVYLYSAVNVMIAGAAVYVNSVVDAAI